MPIDPRNIPVAADPPFAPDATIDDPDAWHEAWTPELHARSAAADDREARGEPRGATWDEVRDRILRGVRRA